MPRPRELSNLVTRRPEAVSRRLTYLDYTEQESHDNTFKRHYKRGRASYRFPEQRAFEVSMVPTWQLALMFFDDVDTLNIFTSK